MEAVLSGCGVLAVAAVTAKYALDAQLDAAAAGTLAWSVLVLLLAPASVLVVYSLVYSATEGGAAANVAAPTCDASAAAPSVMSEPLLPSEAGASEAALPRRAGLDRGAIND